MRSTFTLLMLHRLCARANAPLAYFLPEQCSGLSPYPHVPQAGDVEHLAPEGHVDAERHPCGEFEGGITVIEQRDHRPVRTTTV